MMMINIFDFCSFKPVSLKWLLTPIYDKFEVLFQATFDVEKNREFFKKMCDLLSKQMWNEIVKCMEAIQKRAISKLTDESGECFSVNNSDILQDDSDFIRLNFVGS